MRFRIQRHLGELLDHSRPSAEKAAVHLKKATSGTDRVRIPTEFTAHQYAVLLLHIAAEIEHSLMVEYLYAAFSLGGPGVPKEHQRQVSEWQEVILGIAKEEMGHLMTVQNALRCLGGSLNLDRQDYPWDSDFYPFPFQLERLTRLSLAKYVFVESPPPADWAGAEADEIRELARTGTGNALLHRVGDLYDAILKLLRDPDAVPDRAFRSATYPYQANWDEWARGYQGGARGNAAGGAIPGTPDVIVRPVTCRTDTVAALSAVAMQGEANPTADGQAPSHFARFLKIFRQFPRNAGWDPSRKVPNNPVVSTTDTTAAVDGAGALTVITHPEAVLWAHLFNIRYRLLLTNLLHTFSYPSNLSESSGSTPRGFLVHSTFGEMYNIRALSTLLMQTPLTQKSSDLVAGPPFQMPFTLSLPVDAVDRWGLHLDLLESSAGIVERLLRMVKTDHRQYLQALRSTDEQAATVIRPLMR